MFEKTLGDLIRGIRSHTEDEARAGEGRSGQALKTALTLLPWQTKFISTCMDECRKELRMADLDVKANAIAKLTYLQMLGFDISWAAFNVRLGPTGTVPRVVPHRRPDPRFPCGQVVEVMTSKKFAHKVCAWAGGRDPDWPAGPLLTGHGSLQRIGYLAASQSFHQGTDVLMLTTNMLKKVHALAPTARPPRSLLTTSWSSPPHCIFRAWALRTCTRWGSPSTGWPIMRRRTWLGRAGAALCKRGERGGACQRSVVLCFVFLLWTLSAAGTWATTSSRS
jgi:hypothetical protein